MKQAILEDYSYSRVPVTARTSLFNVTIIRIGFMTALSQFMLGTTLGHAMTLSQAMLAIFLGSLLLEFVSLGLGCAAAREGLATSLLARWCGFGRFGSVLIGAVISICLLGWFGVQNAVLAKALVHALEGQLPLSFEMAAGISGALLTTLVIFAFKALAWTAKLTVPLFFLVIGQICFVLLDGHDLANLSVSPPSGAPLTLGAAATMVAGGFISGALLTPDYCRYSKSNRDVFWVTLLSIIVGEFLVNGVAILIAHALGTADVVTIMTKTAGMLGLLSVVLSVLKINNGNLYSSALSFASLFEGLTGKKMNRVFLTILLGAVGTVLSTLGILEKFTSFLILLGVVFPPIAGVMLVDYYILRTSRSLLDASRQTNTLPPSVPTGSWKAMLACVIGAICAQTIHLGVPSLNALIIGGAVYYLIAVSTKAVKITQEATQVT